MSLRAAQKRRALSALLTTFETSPRLLFFLVCLHHWGLIPRTSSQIFIKVNMSTLVGMEASCAFVKWNSEFARVVRALKNGYISLWMWHLPSRHCSFEMWPAFFKS